MHASRSLLAVLALAALSISAAHADAVYKGNTGVNDYTTFGPGDFDSGTLFPGVYIATDGGETATAWGSPVHGGTIFASALSDGNGPAGATSVLTFEVELKGTGTTYVPVHVQASGYTLVTGSSPVTGGTIANAYAGFVVSPPNAQLAAYSSSTYGGSVQPTLSFDEWIPMLPGTHMDISMQVTVGAGGGGFPGGTAEGFIDPIFTIDPRFAADFTLEGVPEVSAVAEPASGALVLAGLAGLAAAARRRRGSARA